MSIAIDLDKSDEFVAGEVVSGQITLDMTSSAKSIGKLELALLGYETAHVQSGKNRISVGCGRFFEEKLELHDFKNQQVRGQVTLPFRCTIPVSAPG